MKKELQDKAWAALPKELKEEVKRIYKSEYVSDRGYQPTKVMECLANLFDHDNLTSDAEREEIKKAMSGMLVTLGTDTERKFAWCLREVNGEAMIFIHERSNGMTCFNAEDYITAFPVSRILSCLKLL